jgi:hypothetical protein
VGAKEDVAIYEFIMKMKQGIQTDRISTVDLLSKLTCFTYKVLKVLLLLRSITKHVGVRR